MFYLKEAINYAKSNGVKVRNGELAMKLWPNRDEKSNYQNLRNLLYGRVERITPHIVSTLCNELGVSADFLFGRTSIPNQETPDMEKVYKKVNELKESINELEDLI